MVELHWPLLLLALPLPLLVRRLATARAQPSAALLAAALYAPQPASSEPLTEYTRALYSAAQQWIAALPRSTATSQQ